jgi:Uma2 family endonuclease
MTQAQVKFPTFEAYLSWSDDPENFREGRVEWIDGELLAAPPEAEANNWVACFDTGHGWDDSSSADCHS